jgi:hypothetical protein
MEPATPAGTILPLVFTSPNFLLLDDSQKMKSIDGKRLKLPGYELPVEVSVIPIKRWVDDERQTETRPVKVAAWFRTKGTRSDLFLTAEAIERARPCTDSSFGYDWEIV